MSCPTSDCVFLDSILIAAPVKYPNVPGVPVYCLQSTNLWNLLSTPSLPLTFFWLRPLKSTAQVYHAIPSPIVMYCHVHWLMEYNDHHYNTWWVTVHRMNNNELNKYNIYWTFYVTGCKLLPVQPPPSWFQWCVMKQSPVPEMSGPCAKLTPMSHISTHFSWRYGISAQWESLHEVFLWKIAVWLSSNPV